MPPKKNRLSYRKNQQSKTHRARAERNKDKRLGVAAVQSLPVVADESTTDGVACAQSEPAIASNMSFTGFDVPPLRETLRVLSLFDGFSSALFCLDQLGLHVECYYSSEIDERALRLQRFRFPGRIKPLGCIKHLNEDALRDLGHIHLLIGGSPCNDFSLCNPNRRGLHGEMSSGRLFFEYVRVRDFLRSLADENGKLFFWLYENTSSMEKETLVEINCHLGMEPVTRCASHFLPVIRKRFFWGTVPKLNEWDVEASSKESLNNLLSPYRAANVPYLPTLTTSSHSQRSGKEKKLPVLEDGVESPLFITELEALFGFPEHFTDGPNLSLTDRRTLLGKAFCVPVIMHILKPLTSIFFTSNTTQIDPHCQ